MPDTTSYLLLGLTVIAAIMGLFVGSTWLRFRTLGKQVEKIKRNSRN
jgi:hypothetical protein